MGQAAPEVIIHLQLADGVVVDFADGVWVRPLPDSGWLQILGVE